MNLNGITGHEVQLNRLEAMLRGGFMPQALIFHGLGGTGKRKIAMRLLMSMFCRKEQIKPCLTCNDCNLIENNTHPDVLMLLPNEKGNISIGAESEYGSVRWLISRLAKKSISGRYGVIIDGIENLSFDGQNALLKTIEEPPENTLIIMIAENKRMILPTILSRATEIYFGKLSSSDILDILKKQNVYDKSFDRAVALSGGSAEIAFFLTNEDNMRELEIIVSGVVDFIKNKGIINIDLDPLQKKIGARALVRILVCVFRAMLLSELRGEPYLFSKETYMGTENIINLIKLIKILLALEKGLKVNMLLNVSFKGLLYSIDEFPDTGLPEFEDAAF